MDVSLTSGSLVMNTYAYSSTTGSAPDWVFSTTPTPFTLLANATNETVNGTTLPVFEYYGYNSNGTMSTHAVRGAAVERERGGDGDGDDQLRGDPVR